MPAGLWADWNDCLRLGKRGESTFVAMQLYYAMTVIKYFAEMKDDAEYIDYINSIQYKMGETIQEKCWRMTDSSVDTRKADRSSVQRMILRQACAESSVMGSYKRTCHKKAV